MVDFNNETTVTRAFDEIVKVVILQRRYEAINELETIYKKKYSRVQRDLSVLKSKIYSLYIEIKPLIERKHKGFKAFQEQINELQNKNEDELAEVLNTLNDILDDSGLTKIDNIIKYDRTNILEANRRRQV